MTRQQRRIKEWNELTRTLEEFPLERLNDETRRVIRGLMREFARPNFPPDEYLNPENRLRMQTRRAALARLREHVLQ